jgi:hypothetical protein
VNQTIEDGISNRRVGKANVPLGNGHLSSHQCRRATIAIVQNLEQVLRLESGQGITEPVVEDQKLDTGESIQELGVGTVGVRELGLVQEAGGTVIADIEVVAAGGVGQSTGQESLAHARWPEDEDVEVLLDPLALGQVENEATVQTPRGREVEIFHGGRYWQPGGLQASFQAIVVAVGALAVDEQAETILEGQVRILRVVELLFEGNTKSRQAELGQFVEQGLGQHRTPP